MKPSEKFSYPGPWFGVLRHCTRLEREEGTGMAVLEFAMVIPLLWLLLVGILFGGITFFNYVELANAVEAGARELGENGADQGTNACLMEETALRAAAGNLNTSQITIGKETFASGNTCSSAPTKGDAGTVSATYPCNLPIPFTNMNLCPMQGGSTNASCPTPYCISASTTVYIE